MRSQSTLLISALYSSVSAVPEHIDDFYGLIVAMHVRDYKLLRQGTQLIYHSLRSTDRASLFSEIEFLVEFNANVVHKSVCCVKTTCK